MVLEDYSLCTGTRYVAVTGSPPKYRGLFSTTMVLHAPACSQFRVNGMRFAVLASLALTAGSAAAQSCDSILSGGVGTPSLITVGSMADERGRDASVLGRCRPSLIRSPLSLSPNRPSDGWVPRIVSPTLAATWNSTIPVTMNDGAMWAGRGLNTSLTAGIRLDKHFATIVLAPEITASENHGFPIITSSNPNRSPFASPWHELPTSADLPIRFGTDPFALFSYGQTAVEVHSSSIGGGFTTENEWWGPGIRNAIVMSNNAAGVPRLYARTMRPFATFLGDVDAHWELGLLTKSKFFDYGPGSGFRSLSAGAITLRTAFDSGLTIGAARAVYAPINEIGLLPSHWMDVLWRWNQNQSVSYTPGHPTDQITSLFFQWDFPEAGFETYGEWATLIPLRSLRDLIIDPQSHQGFTVGFQWLDQLSTARTVRIQAEATTLEQTPPTPGAQVPTFYTSHISPQGYTQRGQVIGAAIGPGSSSQFIGVDLLRARWTGGIELGRIRWEDEAYYRQITGLFSYRHHDVSIFAGLRGSARTPYGDVSGEFVLTQRNNFLFQSADLIDFNSAFDMRNTMLKCTFTPR
jgi:hypothetical protein